MEKLSSFASIDARLQTLARELGVALLSRSWLLATAESCTGGGIAAAVTDIDGSSQWFECGYVTYSNKAKQEMLGVSEDALKTEGAVSELVVAEMVGGALAHSGAQLAVAVSGIAGPAGGTLEKPVGMVCLAWQMQSKSPVIRTNYFSGDRAAIRKQAVESALLGLIEILRAEY